MSEFELMYEKAAETVKQQNSLIERQSGLIDEQIEEINALEISNNANKTISNTRQKKIDAVRGVVAAAEELGMICADCKSATMQKGNKFVCDIKGCAVRKTKQALTWLKEGA